VESIYREVIKHKWTSHYEAHLWDNNSKRERLTRKGRQVYLGRYSKDEKRTNGPQNDSIKFKEDKYIKAYQDMLMK
jgi:AP2-like factor (ANT lineage)